MLKRTVKPYDVSCTLRAAACAICVLGCATQGPHPVAVQAPGHAPAATTLDAAASAGAPNAERPSCCRGTALGCVRGPERWNGALHGYRRVAQESTPLGAALVPFAQYINAVHRKVHPHFALEFLGTLAERSPKTPANGTDLNTHLEIGIDGGSGCVVRLGVLHSSGVEEFDIGALDAVFRAGPYPVAPEQIRSRDGVVYLRWEFYRRPDWACSMYFAHPSFLSM